jgi:hypothetical protein
LIELFRRACKDQRYWDTWRTSEQWVGIINSLYPEAQFFEFTKNDLNKVVGHHPDLKNCKVVFGSMTNSYGIYSQSYRRDNVRTVAYYATEPGKEVKKPPTDIKWWDQVINRSPSKRKCLAKEDLPHDIITLIVDEKEKKRLKAEKHEENSIPHSTQASVPLHQSVPTSQQSNKNSNCIKV